MTSILAATRKRWQSIAKHFLVATARIRAGRTEKLRFYGDRIRGASIVNVTNDARNEIVCSPNLRHLSRSVILLLSSVPVPRSSSAKELIRINRCFLYTLCSLSHCQERSFSWLIMIRRAASHRLHANFVIRHVYNQLIINHAWSLFFAAHRHADNPPNPLTHSRFINKNTSWRRPELKNTFECKVFDYNLRLIAKD